MIRYVLVVLDLSRAASMTGGCWVLGAGRLRAGICQGATLCFVRLVSLCRVYVAKQAADGFRLVNRVTTSRPAAALQTCARCAPP